MQLLLNISIILNAVLYGLIFSGLIYNVFNMITNKLNHNTLAIQHLTIGFILFTNMLITFMIICLLSKGGF